ncbi:MAG TPA: hypothetical protein VIN59_03005 [Alphaproteobacteria bacterium]
MFAFDVSSFFTVRAARKNKGRQILNYLWVCHERPYALNFDAMCHVPLNAMDNVFENAKKYPDAQVCLWMNLDEMNDTTRYFVQSHFYLFAPDNVRLCNLLDIPAYRHSPMLKPNYEIPEEDGFICRPGTLAKVDLARLYVIKHCFETTSACDVFYSDMDVKDAQLNAPRHTRCLKTFGMVFAKTWDGIENGYMAFRRDSKGQAFLTESLIGRTEERLSKGLGGWHALKDGLDAWGKKTGIWLLQWRLAVMPIPHSGKPMEWPVSYQKMGIN